MGGSSAAPSGRSLCELRIRSSFLPRPLATPSSFLVYLFSLLVPLVFLSSGGVPIVGAFEIGDSVWYFHREDRDKDVANVFVALEDHSHGNFRPRFGLSEGWLPGQIVNMSAEGVVKGGEGNEQYGYGADGSLTSVDCEDRDAEGRCLSKKKEWFLIRTSWSLWGANSGIFCCGPDDEPGRHLYRNVTLDMLRQHEKPLRPNTFAANTRPKLSIIAARWGGHTKTNTKESELLSTNPNYLFSLLDIGVRPLLGWNYEVWSLWIGKDEDAQDLSKFVPHVFSEQHSARRAERTATAWFVHPTSFDIESTAAMLTGTEGAGYIGKDAVFNLMRGFERAGMYTMFPHTSRLYESLASKNWNHMLPLDTKFKIPPTVQLPRVLARHVDPYHGAKQALESLEIVKRSQWRENGQCDGGTLAEVFAEDGGKMCKVPAIGKGVAKLGYSWEALDVKLWDESSDYKLSDALRDLSDTIRIRGQYVGQSHYLDHIMVQEFVPHSLELRLYYIENKLVTRFWTKFDRVKDNHEFGDFYYMNEDVALSYVRGDRKALAEAERQARHLSERWLSWLTAMSSEPIIPAIRFDFFVQYLPDEDDLSTKEKKALVGGVHMDYEEKWDRTVVHDAFRERGNTELTGAVNVWTLEICEAGFSIFGDSKVKNHMMQAFVRAALRSG